jgi:hypothetical protein
MCAIAALVILAMFFFLDTSRFLGSRGEQATAIEAAALAAAKDISNIVIDDSDLGFISLSDMAPAGRNTTAGDNYYLSVRGINSVLATVRLDMIIADLLNDNTMRKCALRDYDSAMRARANLITALQNAIASGGFGHDVDGNLLSPLNDASQAYEQNAIRIARGKSKLVPGSMKLTLGYISGVTSNTQIPTPSSYSNLSATQQDNSMYKPFVDIRYDSKDFVFAATGNTVSLTDALKFQTSLPGLPYEIPSIIKCEADQQFDEIDHTGHNLRRVVHSAAAAEPACNTDTMPNAGSLLLSFPNGSVPELTTLFTVLTNTQIAKSPSDMTETVLGGDYTPNAMSGFALPVLGTQHAPFGQVMRIGLYDWIRRAGHRADISSLLTSFNTPLAMDGSSHADVFKFGTDGTVAVSYLAIPPTVSLPVSNKQYMGVSGCGFQSSSGALYDVFVKDYTYQAGKSAGGIHAGELLSYDPNPPPGGPPPPGLKQIGENPSLISSFPTGPAGGAPRPTYLQNGTAAEIRFRMR